MKIRNLHMSFLTGALAPCLGVGSLQAQQLFDVFFLTDTTGSMGSLINGVQTSSTTIFDRISSSADVMFGAGEYKDANSDAFGFRYNLVEDGLPILTSDRSTLITAINQWTASGGGDTPEDNLHGVRESAADTPWREGSRRFIFWFGDARGTDPSRDGTTLADALEALNDNCIELIAVDLGGLDDTGQATALTEGDRDCGDGMLVDAGEVAELSLSGLSEDEIAAEVERLITELFGTRSGTSGGEDVAFMRNSMRAGSISVARTVMRDVGGRLYRLRAGVGPATTVVTEPAPTYSAKGGMAKGGMPTTTTVPKRWEVYGQLFYSTDDQDAEYSFIPGTVGGAPGTARLLRPDTTTDVFGGTIGVDYDLSPNWTVGFALSGASSDIDVGLVGDTDIDTIALMPYVSYRRAINDMGFYADLLYAYGMNDYDTTRSNGAVGSTDGDFNALEFNTGLTLKTATLVHGPYAQLRYIDGQVDSYTEFGPGGATYPTTDYKSLASQLGYQLSRPISAGSGVVVPQIRAAWEHEFEADQGYSGVIPLGEADEDLAILGAGVGYYADAGWNILLDYEARLGSETQAQFVGLKGGYEF